MGYQSKDNKAAYNISQGKGFECPVCNRFVSYGYDYCPHCGDTPGASGGTGMMKEFLWFWSVPVLFFTHWFSTMNSKFLNVLILLPAFVIFYQGFKELWTLFKDLKDCKQRYQVSWIKAFIVYGDIFISIFFLFVTYFSGSALLNIMKTYLISI